MGLERTTGMPNFFSYLPKVSSTSPKFLLESPPPPLAAAVEVAAMWKLSPENLLASIPDPLRAFCILLTKDAQVNALQD